MGRYLNRSKIMASEDRRKLEVQVPEWGGTLLLLAPAVSELEAYQLRHRDVFVDGRAKDAVESHVAAELVALCICDENGKREFPGPAEVLEFSRAKSPIVINRLFDQCQALCGMTKASQAEAKKNSEPTPSGDSG